MHPSCARSINLWYEQALFLFVLLHSALILPSPLFKIQLHVSSSSSLLQMGSSFLAMLFNCICCIPLSLLLPTSYHVWLWREVHLRPLRITVGINAATEHELELD